MSLVWAHPRGTVPSLWHDPFAVVRGQHDSLPKVPTLSQSPNSLPKPHQFPTILSLQSHRFPMILPLPRNAIPSPPTPSYLNTFQGHGFLFPFLCFWVWFVGSWLVFLLQFLIVSKTPVAASARRGGHQPCQPLQLLLRAATGSGMLGDRTGRGQGTTKPAWCSLDAGHYGQGEPPVSAPSQP